MVAGAMLPSGVVLPPGSVLPPGAVVVNPNPAPKPHPPKLTSTDKLMRHFNHMQAEHGSSLHPGERGTLEALSAKIPSESALDGDAVDDLDSETTVGEIDAA